MEEKYLPIGTVVTKKGSSKKYMIIGYSPIIYIGKLTTYDYSACPYPEGIILKNQDSYFNHEEIEQIDYIGYKSAEYQQFLSTIITNDETISNTANTSNENNNFNNLKFDENGIVIFDGTTNNDFKDELKDIQFDENGFVVSVAGEKLDNPFITPVDIDGHKQPDENKDMSIFKDYKFDENGFVISDETVKTENNTQTNNNLDKKYDFDENGFVINDGNEPLSSSQNSQYQFDKVESMAKDDNDDAGEILDINPVSENTVEYKFDENGIVIGE